MEGSKGIGIVQIDFLIGGENVEGMHRAVFDILDHLTKHRSVVVAERFGILLDADSVQKCNKNQVIFLSHDLCQINHLEFIPPLITHILFINGFGVRGFWGFSVQTRCHTCTS